MQPAYVHLPKLTEGYLFFFALHLELFLSWVAIAGDLTLGQTVESSWITFVIWCGYVPLYWQQLGSQRMGCLGSVDFCLLQTRGQARQDRNGGGQEMVKRCMEMQNPWQDPFQLSKMHRPQDKSHIIFDAFRLQIISFFWDIWFRLLMRCFTWLCLKIGYYPRITIFKVLFSWVYIGSPRRYGHVWTWGTLSTRGSLLDSSGGALRVHLTCDLVYLREFLLAKRSKLETPSVMAFMAPATATFSWLLDLSDLWSGVVRSWNSSFFAWGLFLTTICTLRLSSTIFCHWTRSTGSCRAKALNKVWMPSRRWKQTWLRCLAAFVLYGMAKSWPLGNFKDLATIRKRQCVIESVSLTCALRELAGMQKRLLKYSFLSTHAR